MLLVIGTVFLALGGTLLSHSIDVISIRERYDDALGCDDTKWDKPGFCNITFDLDEDMDEPVFLHYELIDFYQSNRYYKSSVNWKQARGDDLEKEELSSCKPYRTMEDLGRILSKEDMGGELGQHDIANPCGLIAKTLFNDTFELLDPQGQSLELSFDDLIIDAVKDRYERTDDWKDKQWTDVEDEHYIVWMETSGMPSSKKLWARIDSDLPEGKYTLRVKSYYDLEEFDGEKWASLSTATHFGGKQRFLSMLLLANGAVLVGFTLYFFLKSLRAN